MCETGRYQCQECNCNFIVTDDGVEVPHGLSRKRVKPVDGDLVWVEERVEVRNGQFEVVDELEVIADAYDEDEATTFQCLCGLNFETDGNAAREHIESDDLL